MKRSEIRAGEWYILPRSETLWMAMPVQRGGHCYDAPDGGYGGPQYPEDITDVTLTDPPPWFAARWVSRDAMTAATTKILAALNFGDEDEAKSDLRNSLEQLRKGAENE